MVKIFIVFCYLNNFLTAKLRISIQKWCHTGYNFVVTGYNFVVTGYNLSYQIIIPDDSIL